MLTINIDTYNIYSNYSKKLMTNKHDWYTVPMVYCLQKRVQKKM